jgi:hypothetical protein
MGLDGQINHQDFSWGYTKNKLFTTTNANKQNYVYLS